MEKREDIIFLLTARKYVEFIPLYLGTVVQFIF